jgi:hypothetical protein
VSKATRESLFTVAYVVVGLVAVIAVGYLTLGYQFFQFTRPDGHPGPMLPFLVVGLTGSLIYAIVQMRGAGLAILMILLLFLTQVAMTPPIRPNKLVAAALYSLPIGFALLTGAYVQKALTRFKIGRFTVMGVIVAAGYGLMMLLWLVRSPVGIQGKLVLRQALVGLELGAAMGLGFELVDLIGPRPKPKLDAERPPK